MSNNILKRKAHEWAKLVVKLHNTKVPKDLINEKKALISFAKKIKDSIEGVMGVVPELAPIGQLGGLPALLIVGVAGAATAITKWTFDYKRFNKKLEERKLLEAGGMSPSAAAAIVNQAESKSPLMSVFSDSKKIIGISVVGLGIYYFTKKRGMF